MFNLEYIAANTGATLENGADIFAYETLTSNANGEITLGATPIPVITNGTAYVWYRKSSENVEMSKTSQISGTTVSGLAASTEYCVMYRKSVDGDTITINSQFIPDTLHAVLTVALYSGDNCNPESATKAGEVVIDIPRLQLSGAQEISMTATGSASTPLEGNALASGCTGCDGKPIYATISRVITGANWTDGVEGLIIEDPGTLEAGASGVPITAYAVYANKAPRKLANNEWTLSAAQFGDDGADVNVDDDNKTVSNTTLSEGTDPFSCLLVGHLKAITSIEGATVITILGSK